ncbi:sugar phosphate isomerase/epimerase family protein [Dictyobacter aurantiacus]|uniref:Xylose isomerase-like TIM barrel domain-containing protein n=1 Tax=Dictyobacter aurantiacus TaxID=1936993 RepID=A0A401ZL95_9CHLR|nr:sugar phosphate isomerase/epimerase family protein [Dictyobacter aurantiacus]GCE07594.1 hypothetical protein KDAU_49230 [Dictyobacter aurantiacus]
MKFGICTSFRTISQLNEIALDYLEENVQRFLIPERPQVEFEELLHAVRQLPFPVEAANSLLPADLRLIESPSQHVDRPRLESYMRTALRRAEQAGIRIFVFGSGGARNYPADIEKEAAAQQLAEHMATWSGWAREHGVQIVLEPLRYEETNILNTVAEGGALVSTIAGSGARLLADVYHMACNGEDPESILPYRSLLAHVHVAEKQDRAAPGHHGEDFRPYFSALHRAGYDQRISIECNWSDFSSEAVPALAQLRTQWEESSRQTV